MSIVVAYKWAANPQDANVDAEGIVDWSRAKLAISEYDPVAIELGRRLADSLGTDLIGVSVGGKELISPMAKKSALSRGLDRIEIVANERLTHADSTTTGIALAGLIKTLDDVSIVVTGDSSVDVGAQLVPAILAGALDWPLLTGVTSISGQAGNLTVERNYQGGTQVLTVTGPAVLSAATDAIQPRVPGMKDILAAGKKPAQEVDLESLELSLPAAPEVVSTAKPQLAARKGEIIDGSDPQAAAAQLVTQLRTDHAI